MDSLRKTALVAGVLYLATSVSIPTRGLYGAVRNDPDDVTGAGPDAPALVGGVLEVIVALAGIGTAVALYPVVKRQNEGAALGFAGARVLEATGIAAGVVSRLSVVTLRRAGAGAAGLIAWRNLRSTQLQLGQGREKLDVDRQGRTNDRGPWRSTSWPTAGRPPWASL
jgi:hypothetical protein